MKAYRSSLLYFAEPAQGAPVQAIFETDGLLVVGPGKMVTVPALNLRFEPLHGFSTAANSAVPHNALHDARALRDHIMGMEH